MAPNPPPRTVPRQLGQRYADDHGRIWRCAAVETQGEDRVAVLVCVVEGVEWAWFVPLWRLM